MPSSSLALSVGTVILSAIVPSISAQTYSYTLQDTYAGSNFYNNFNFFSDSDPTHGFVSYVNQSVASDNGLIGFGTNTAKWGVDTSNVISNTSTGRQSVRLEGKNTYTHGLFLADIKHMPGSICGVWPAFWTLGDSTWPAHGEMDIIEGVNQGTGNQYTAHTADNCSFSFPSQTGPVYKTDCAVSASTDGCSVGSSGNNDYGTNFNSNGGGVYAMQWTSSFIKIWFFPRGSIPASITSGSPDYTSFGTPQANFAGSGCDIDSHFINHHIIFDTTFCGDWAGSVYSSSTCPGASSGSNGCVNYVANTPSAFSEAYWEVNYVKVYSETVVSSTSSSAISSSTRVSSSSLMSSTTGATSSSSLTSSSAAVSSSSSASSSFSTVTVGPPMSTSSSTSSATSSASKATSTSSAVFTSSTISTSTVKTSTISSTTSKASSNTSSSVKASSTTSSSVKTSTTSVTSSVKSSTTTLKTSTSSTKTSTSASPTATTTTATCPAGNGKIYVSNSKRFLIECSTDHAGGNLKTVTVSTSGGLAACIAQCATTTGCVDVTLSGTACYLKSALGASTTSSANGAKLLT